MEASISTNQFLASLDRTGSTQQISGQVQGYKIS